MGTPAATKGTRKEDLYDQYLDTVAISGAVIIQMDHSWKQMNLTGNVTTITTLGDLTTNERAIYTFLIIQGPAAYTIDWLVSGKFVSSVDSAALQPNTAAGSITRYQAIWNGSTYELQINKA